MEMEIKNERERDQRDENLRNSVPFVKKLSTESNRDKNTNYSINADPKPPKKALYLRTQVGQNLCQLLILLPT